MPSTTSLMLRALLGASRSTHRSRCSGCGRYAADFLARSLAGIMITAGEAATLATRPLLQPIGEILLQMRCTWRNARLPMQLTRAIKVGRFDGERCGIRAETIDAGR